MKIRGILWSVILLVAIACQQPSQEKNEKGFIRVKGVDLVTPDGEKFLIRGTNLGNWLNPEGYMFLFNTANSPARINQAFCEMVGPEFTAAFWRQFKDNYVTEADIRFLKETGINSVRLPFHYKLFTDEDYMGITGRQDGFERVDSLIGWCRNAGLYLILDMHDAPGGQTGDNIDDSYGYPWLLENKDCQKQFVDIWVNIASRYKEEPVILGYDLMNEPIAPYFENKDELNSKLEPLYKKVVKAIREVDTNHVVLLGGAQWNGNFDVFTDWNFDRNMMYTCHRYGGEPTTEAIQNLIAFRDKTNLPMYMGETGENTDEWIRNFRYTLEQNNIGWHFWPYKKMKNPTSFVHIPVPENWDKIVAFTECPRVSFQDVRAARPDQGLVMKAMNDLLENCRFGNCVVNEGYVKALTE